ncbi:penicillin acylase family protein [Myxococcota bacterium]|nr:penicillin acylase family protein [Myxococcota bacterium]MBU1898259.1 penicillin acylase family protein [Myxococcota bacterium]
MLRWRCLSACMILATLSVACDDQPPQLDAEPPDTGAADLGADLNALPPVDLGVDLGVDASGVDLGADASGAAQIEAVAEAERWVMPTLSAPAQVLFTDLGVPHIYAANRLDLRRVMGFLMARDRFFTLDLFRRASTGQLSALVGELALGFDVLARAQGQRRMAERIDAWLTDDLRAEQAALAEGINAYIEAVADGALPPPSELATLAPLLGMTPVEAMTPFSAFDVSALMASTAFMTGFESVDLEHSQALDALAMRLAEAPDGDLRWAGVLEDVFERVAPVYDVASVPGAFDLKRAKPSSRLIPRPRPRRLAPGLLDGLLGRLGAQSSLWWRRPGGDRGSNAWAVSGSATQGDGALLAGDGHLQLWVPTLLYRLGADTSVYGAGDVTFAGLVLPGSTPYAIGTNGQVAWSFTYFYGDLTDWYAEEIQLGADGLPAAARFQDAWRPLSITEEVYEVRGRIGQPPYEARMPRFELEDGRRLLAVEGRAVTDEAPALEGEAVVDLGAGLVVPGDQDGDGIVSGVSMIYTGLFTGPLSDAYAQMAEARSVEAFRAAHRRLGTNGSSFVAADAAGGVLNTGYHAAPCRAYLPRDAQNRWAEGADPSRLLDGTRFGAFEVILDAEGRVSDGADDPQHCTTPFEAFPFALNPSSGFVFTANNDPAGGAFDDNMANDPHYLGGSWAPGFRAKTIHDRLAALVARGGVGVEDMVALQAEKTSVTAARYLLPLLDALKAARADQGAAGLAPSAARAAAAYSTEAAAMDEVIARLEAWAARGALAASGVETFYEHPDEGARADAAATMIWNAWLSRVIRRIVDDEGLPPVDRLGDKSTLVRVLDNLLFGRGPDNPRALASWVEATGESVLFDDLRTPEVERSDEIIVLALADALAFLRSPPTAPGEGGFGVDEMDAWLWGMRHTVRFEHILQVFLGAEGGGIGALLGRFGLNPQGHPARPDLPMSDPVNQLPGYPRGGDNFNVDAAHPQFFGDRFEYRDGAVMRMVVRFDQGRVEGRNVIPGGQSGLVESPHFADQAALWLGNESAPLRFHLDQVLEGATSRAVFTPTARPSEAASAASD